MSILGGIGKTVGKVVANEVDARVVRWPSTDEERQAWNDIIAHRYDLEDLPNNTIVQVEQGQLAIFRNEAGQAVVVPPGERTIETLRSQARGLNQMRDQITGGVSAHHNYLYFINTTTLSDIPFGTANPIEMITYDLQQFNNGGPGVPVRVRSFGSFSAKIYPETPNAAIMFLEEIVGSLPDLTKSAFSKRMTTDIILKTLIDNLGKIMITNRIGLLSAAPHYLEISNELEKIVAPQAAVFGVTVLSFTVLGISAEEEDRKKLEALFEAANTNDIESNSRARQRAVEGYTYQQERGYDVLGTAAANEATPGQFMGAGMGLGMGLGIGGAFGGAMGNMAQNAFGNMNYPSQGAYGYQSQPYGYPPQNPYGYGYQQNANGQNVSGQGQPYGYPYQGAYGYQGQPYGYPPQNGYPYQGQPVNGQQNGAQTAVGQGQATAAQNQTPNPDGQQAAQQQAVNRKCANCGADIPTNAMFCPFCGNKCE